MPNSNSSTDSDREQRTEQIRQVAKECLLARAKGEAVADEALIQAHPELMPELADELRNLQMIERADQKADQTDVSGLHIRCPHCHNPVELVDDASLSGVECPSCGSQFSLVDDADRTYQAHSEQTVGHFQLLDKVGMGAFGSVWSARDTELDRQVAVKIPRKGQLSAEDGELFIREARAAAQLKHPHIVSVLEVGRHEDRIYIVTEFVQGLDLADWLTDQQATPHEAADLCATMADALQHAHDQGVVHRDLKPSNIMLDTSGEPHLMDFGLAKRESGEMTMTIEGKLLGTPAYMSPEQARGAAHDADARTDVYSLGVILFELLTGERPFRGSTRMLLHQVLVEDAPSPRKLNSQVPKDLETICLKCLEKAADRRYQTAAELREDLQRFLRREPVEARPITKVARAWRWCKRKPVIAGLSVTLASSLLILGIGGPIVAVNQRRMAERELAAHTKTTKALDEAEVARDEARNAQAALRRQLYVSDMSNARQALERTDISKVVELVDRHLPSEGEEDLREFGWYQLWKSCQRSIMAPRVKGGRIDGITHSPDGKTLISLDVGLGQVTYRDADTLALQDTYSFDNKSTNGGWLFPDGKSVLLAMERKPDENRSMRLLNLGTGEEQLLKMPFDDFMNTTISPNGKLMAVRFTEKQRTVADNPIGIPRAILWSVPTGQQLFELKGPGDQYVHDELITDTCFSPDGRILATGSRDLTAKLWDTVTGKLLATFTTTDHTQNRSSVWEVEFSPDGTQLAVGTSGENLILLFDVASRRLIHKLPGHTSYVRRLAFSKDGKILASAGSEDTDIIRIWNVESGEQVKSLPTYRGGMLSFSPDGSTLANSNARGSVTEAWRLKETQNPRIHRLPRDYLLSAVAPDFTMAAMATETGQIEVWDVETDAEVSQFSHGARIIAIAWIAPRQIVTASHDGKVHIWNANTGKLLETLETEKKLDSLSTSPRNHLLAVGSPDGTISIFDWKLERPREKTIRSQSPGLYLQHLVFSPDGRRLASTVRYHITHYADGRERDNTKLWDATTGELVHTFDEIAATSMAFSADSSTFALGRFSGEIILWDIESKTERARLLGNDGRILSMSFSQDGRWLFSGGVQKVTTWDLATNMNMFELEASRDGVRLLTVTPDLRTLFTAEKHDYFKQWNAASEHEVQQMRQRWQEKQAK